MGVQEQLEQIAGSADPKQKAELYKQLLGGLIQAAAEADLNAFVDHSECRAGTVSHRSADSGSFQHACVAVLPEAVPSWLVVKPAFNKSTKRDVVCMLEVSS
jgi:hypothetical protein